MISPTIVEAIITRAISGSLKFCVATKIAAVMLRCPVPRHNTTRVSLAVLVMTYLGWLVEAHPGICGRLVYLSQPLPDKPDFLAYRLLGGLKETINTCFWLHKDLLRKSLQENP